MKNINFVYARSLGKTHYIYEQLEKKKAIFLKCGGTIEEFNEIWKIAKREGVSSAQSCISIFTKMIDKSIVKFNTKLTFPILHKQHIDLEKYNNFVNRDWIGYAVKRKR